MSWEKEKAKYQNMDVSTLQQVVDVKIRERDLTALIIPSEEQGWSSDNSVDQATMLQYFTHEYTTD
jgi:hypothetical protein